MLIQFCVCNVQSRMQTINRTYTIHHTPYSILTYSCFQNSTFVKCSNAKVLFISDRITSNALKLFPIFNSILWLGSFPRTIRWLCHFCCLSNGSDVKLTHSNAKFMPYSANVPHLHDIYTCNIRSFGTEFRCFFLLLFFPHSLAADCGPKIDVRSKIKHVAIEQEETP